MRILRAKIETTVLCEPGNQNAHGHLARFIKAVLRENLQEKWRAPRWGEPMGQTLRESAQPKCTMDIPQGHFFARIAPLQRA